MGKLSIGGFIDDSVDADQTGEESEVKVKKCEGRSNSTSRMCKKNKVYFSPIRKSRGRNMVGVRSKKRWAGRKTKAGAEGGAAAAWGNNKDC